MNEGHSSSGMEAVPEVQAARNAGRERFWYAALLAGLFVFVFLSAFFHVSDVDIGYHIRTGAHILEHGHIPTTNTFSYTTPGQEWLIQQWWPGIFYNRVYHFGGIPGLISVKACIAAVLMMVVFCAARRLSKPGSLWPFWLVTIGVLIARVRFFERPDLISAVIFATVFYLDLRFDKDRRWQWIGLPLIMGFWANTHGGLVYGAVLLCVTSAAEWIEHFRHFAPGRARAAEETIPPLPDRNVPDWKVLMIRPLGLALSFFACVLSLELINPNGWRVMLVPVYQFTSGFWQGVISEYQTPSWRSAPLFYLSLAALAILQFLTWRRLRLRFFFILLAFAYLACTAQRSLLYYSIAAIPCAAMLISHLPEMRWAWRLRRLESLLLPVAWAGLVFVVIIPNKLLHFGVGFYKPYYPVEIYSFIKEEVPPQNIFHDMRYGGGMLWFLYPHFRPYLDGRGDAYTPEFWTKEYFPVLTAQPGWRDILRKHDAHGVWVAIAHTRLVSELAKQLFADPQWALVAFTDHSLLFLERTELNRGVIASNEFRYVWPGDLSFSNVTSATAHLAVIEAERAFRHCPDSLFSKISVARTRLVAGDYPRAAAFFAALEFEGTNDEGFWRDYGYCLFRLGKYEEAEGIFQRMINKGWLVGYAWYMRHFIALKSNRLADAERCLAEAIAAEPNNPEYREAQARLNAATKRAAAF
jgi:pentatricopeptide repeat protein